MGVIPFVVFFLTVASRTATVVSLIATTSCSNFHELNLHEGYVQFLFNLWCVYSYKWDGQNINHFNQRGIFKFNSWHILWALFKLSIKTNIFIYLFFSKVEWPLRLATNDESGNYTWPRNSLAYQALWKPFSYCLKWSNMYFVTIYHKLLPWCGHEIFFSFSFTILWLLCWEPLG